jgi:hypothetical protein
MSIDINSPEYLSFNETMEREGQLIEIDGKLVNVFFRTEKGVATGKNKEQFITAFTDFSDNIKQGSIFNVGDGKYIAIKDNSDENTIYNKTFCIKCNQTIKYMLRQAADINKADLTIFYVNADDLSQSASINSDVSTLTSTGHFTFPYNDLTKRLLVNDRFYAGNSIPWSIRDINYQNDLVEVYCQRSQKDTVYDDIDNLIADRWRFEHKPDTYTILAEPSTVTLIEGTTQQLTVSISKNGEAVTPIPSITWSASNSICSISENVITANSAGSCAITGSYKAQDNDICNPAVISVTVTPKPIAADIVVTPAYDSGSYYSLLQSDTKTFTATIDGVENPEWSITLNANGISSSDYVSTISGNTFTVKCNYPDTTKKLDYQISEKTTGKSTNYYIKLASMF